MYGKGSLFIGTIPDKPNFKALMFDMICLGNKTYIEIVFVTFLFGLINYFPEFRFVPFCNGF